MRKGKEEALDPSGRFVKRSELISARTCTSQFKGYDTVTGNEVT